jgi:hypothetical protein
VNRAERRAARKKLSRQRRRPLPAFLGGQPRVLWHYTVVQYLSSILEAGIRPATAFIEAGERPVVWCSYRSSWERICNKAVGDEAGEIRSLDETGTDQFFGLARLQVPEELAPYTWSDFIQMSGVRPKMAAALKQLAVEAGSDVADWRVAFDTIPPDRLLAVEVKHDGEWVEAVIKPGD